MSDLTNAAADVYHATQEVKNIIDTYNQACQDVLNAQSYDNPTRAALAYIRAVDVLKNATEKVIGLNLPLTGEAAAILDLQNNILKEKYHNLSDVQNLDYKSKYNDQDLIKFFDQSEIKNPKTIGNLDCPTLDYPIPPAPVSKDFIDEIKDTVRDWWDRAIDFILRRDPLTFDLDGDGLETVGASSTNPILFDHDGDGIKNGTGWVASDDAMLVLDRNGNGTIDNGRELFGDNTIKSNGQLATDGFDALADLDSNADGQITSSRRAHSLAVRRMKESVN